MGVDYGKDYEYAGTRLRDSLIRVGKKAFYCDSVCPGSGKVGGHSILSGKFDTVPIEQVNLSPVPLGYVNTHKGLNYVLRKPQRHWKQGLTSKTIFATRGGLHVTDHGLAKTVEGLFPSMSFAGEVVVCGEATGVAFSRNYAFHKSAVQTNATVDLMFRETCVGQGFWNKAAKRFNLILNKKFSYLQQHLEEETNV